MNWLLAVFICLGVFIVALVILIFLKNSFKNKLLIIFILFSPIIFYVLDYQFVYYQHEKDCKAEGGLKVWNEPVKSDRILIKVKNSTGYKAAESHLKNFYPNLREVFVLNDWGKDKGKYFVSRVISTTDDKYKRDWVFSHTEIELPSEPLYMVTKEESYNKSLYQHKQVWFLTKGDKTYATITNFDRFWPKIRYPDGVPGWSCEPVGNHFPSYYLTQLLLK